MVSEFDRRQVARREFLIVSSTDDRSHDEATFFFCVVIPRDSSTTLGMTEEVNARKVFVEVFTSICEEVNAEEYSRKSYKEQSPQSERRHFVF